MRSKGAGSGLARFPRGTLVVAAAVVAVLVGLGIGLPLALSSSGGHATRTGVEPISALGKLVAPPALGSPGPEGPPLESGPDLAPAASPPPGGSVDGISCDAGEQLLFHIHARLTIFVDGRSVRIPAGVGIADPQAVQSPRGTVVESGSCFSWLHTHADDGVVHIESPVQRRFTLGDFFDIWSQPLSESQVGPAKGRVTALVGNRVWLGDPRAIPLRAHAQIQLEVGNPLVGPVRITRWFGL